MKILKQCRISCVERRVCKLVIVLQPKVEEICKYEGNVRFIPKGGITTPYSFLMGCNFTGNFQRSIPTILPRSMSSGMLQQQQYMELRRQTGLFLLLRKEGYWVNPLSTLPRILIWPNSVHTRKGSVPRNICNIVRIGLKGGLMA